MMVTWATSLSATGWYHGVEGTRLMWLPEDMRPVGLATSRQTFGSRHLVAGQNANNITICDMEDYLQGLPFDRYLRESGVRYVQSAEVRWASTLAGVSRLPVWRYLILLILLADFIYVS
jgi:hypothetical protein